MNAKEAARSAIDKQLPLLIDLSHRIHANPELAFEEVKASTWIAAMLADAGFAVESGAFGLPTAFMARAGSGPLHIAICAEYDALPGIGHACGHNMIAAMSAGAGIAAAKLADDLGLTISVIGTPAEESGGGKILLLQRGAFHGVHAAMMVHPTPFDAILPRLISAAEFDVHYHGRDAHASMAPELGINAADALTVAQTAIGLLRQHLRAGELVHGITLKGGDAPNIIPSHTIARYMIRADTMDQLADLRPKVHRCFEAGAVATGCGWEIVGGAQPYAQVAHDSEIAGLYRRNAEAIGRRFQEPAPGAPRSSASTDMGNVSLQMPVIHPFIGIDSLPAVNHQPEFAAHCVKQAADRAVRDGAVAMAWTAIDMAGDAALRMRLTGA